MPKTCSIKFVGLRRRSVYECHPVLISRDQPPAVANHMSSSEWTSFCGKIDAALMPMSRVRRMSRNIAGAIMGAYPLVLVLRLVMYLAGGGLDVARIVGIVSFAVLGLATSSLVGVQVYAKITSTAVLQSLETICEDTSKQYPQLLSFHVRHVHILSFCGCICNRSHRKLSGLHSVALRYIEVKVADVEAPATGEVGGLGGSSALSLVAVSLGGGERKTAAGRLRDLNEMPDMLSQEECYGKKRDILDSV